MIATARSKPAEISALKARVLAMALAGAEAKEIAAAIDRTIKNTYSWMAAVGLRRMYVTAEERALVMAARVGRNAESNREAA